MDWQLFMIIGKCFAQDGLDFGRQHFQVKRFRYKIVPAHVYRHNNIHIIGSRGQEKVGTNLVFGAFAEKNLTAALLAGACLCAVGLKFTESFRYFSDFPAPVKAIVKRKSDVQQHKMRFKSHHIRQDIAEIRTLTRLSLTALGSEPILFSERLRKRI